MKIFHFHRPSIATSAPLLPTCRGMCLKPSAPHFDVLAFPAMRAFFLAT